MDRMKGTMERRDREKTFTSKESKGSTGRDRHMRREHPSAELLDDFNPNSEEQLKQSRTNIPTIQSVLSSSLLSTSRHDASPSLTHIPPLRGLKGPTTFAHNSVAPFYKPGGVPLLSKNLVEYIMDKRKKGNNNSMSSNSNDNTNLLVTSDEIQNVVRPKEANGSDCSSCIYYRLLDMLPDTLISSASAPAIALPLNNHSIYVGPKVGPNKASQTFAASSAHHTTLSIDVPHWFKANNGFFMKGIALCVASQALANFYICANNNRAVKSTYHVLCEVPPGIKPPPAVKNGDTKFPVGAAHSSKNAAFQESIIKGAAAPASKVKDNTQQYRKPPFLYSSQTRSDPTYWSPFIDGNLFSGDCLNERGTLNASINHTCVVHFPEVNHVLRNKLAMTKLFDTSSISNIGCGSSVDNEATNLIKLQNFFSNQLLQSEAENIGKESQHRDQLARTINHPILDQYERHLQEAFLVDNVVGTQQQHEKNKKNSLFWLDTPGARHPFLPIEYCLSLTPWELTIDQTTTIREVTEALKKSTVGSLLLNDGETYNISQSVSPLKADHIRQGARRVQLHYTLLHYNPTTCLGVYEVESCSADEHQIRTIFAHSGAPVVGDLMYNRKVIHAVISAHNNVLAGERRIMEKEHKSVDPSLIPLGRRNRLQSINAAGTNETSICPSASSLFLPLVPSANSQRMTRQTGPDSTIAISPLETVVRPLSLFKSAISNVINKYVALRRHFRLRFEANAEEEEQNPTQLVLNITKGIASISNRWAAGTPPKEISIEYISRLKSPPTCEETLIAALYSPLSATQQDTSLRIVCQCYRLIHDIIKETNNQTAPLQISTVGGGYFPPSLLVSYLVSLSLGPCVAISRLTYPSSKNVNNGLRLQAMELHKEQTSGNSSDHAPRHLNPKQSINDKKTAAALKAKEEGRFDNSKLFDTVVISATSKGATSTFAHSGQNITATSASTLPWSYQLALKLKPVLGIPPIRDEGAQKTCGIAPPASVLSFNELVHQKKSGSLTESRHDALGSLVPLPSSSLSEDDIFSTMVSLVVGGLGAEEEGGVRFCEKCNVVGHSSRHQCPLLKSTQQDGEDINTTSDRILSQLRPLPASTDARALLRQSKMVGKQIQIDDETSGEPVEDLDFFSGYTSLVKEGDNSNEYEEHKKDDGNTRPTQRRHSIMGSRGAASSLSFALGSLSPAGVMAFADEERAYEIEEIQKRREGIYENNSSTDPMLNKQVSNDAALSALSASHMTNTGALRFMDNVERRDRMAEANAARNLGRPYLHQSRSPQKQVIRCSYCFGPHSVVECSRLGLGAVAGSNRSRTNNNGDIIIGRDGSERKVVKSFGLGSSIGAAVKGRESQRGEVEAFDLKLIAGVTDGTIDDTALFCIRCGNYGHFHEDCSTLPADFDSEAKMSRCTVCLARKAVVAHEPHQCGKCMKPPHRPGLPVNEQYHPCGVLRKYFNEEKEAHKKGRGSSSHNYQKKQLDKNYRPMEITEKPARRNTHIEHSSSSRPRGAHTLYHEIPDQ